MKRTVTETRKAIVTRQVRVHRNFHQDEVVAYALVRMFGEEYFPGVQDATIVYLADDPCETQDEADRNGDVDLGIGRDRRFNEHLFGCDEERMDNECCATLVAGYLEVADLPYLSRLLTEVLACDTGKKCLPHRLADLIKAGHRHHHDNEDGTVFNWALTAISAVMICERDHPEKAPSELTLQQIFDQVGEDLCEGNPDAFGVLGQYVEKSMELKDECVIEMAHIVECLCRTAALKDTIDWVMFALDLLLKDQIEFQKVRAMIAKIDPISIPVNYCGRREYVKLVVCQTDSPAASKAARSLGMEIVLVRQSSGNCQILTADRFRAKMENLVRMLRFTETEEGDRCNADWQGLGCVGNHYQVGNWYFFKGRSIFNGSDTHAARPTRTALRHIVDMIKRAFCYDLVREWCDERGIRMNAQEVVEVETHDAASQADEVTVPEIQAPVRNWQDALAETFDLPSVAQKRPDSVPERQGVTNWGDRFQQVVGNT